MYGTEASRSMGGAANVAPSSHAHIDSTSAVRGRSCLPCISTMHVQAMRAQPAERPTAEQMHCHAWLREPLVTTPVARLASAEEAGGGALCVAQLAAALPPI